MSVNHLIVPALLLLASGCSENDFHSIADAGAGPHPMIKVTPNQLQFGSLKSNEQNVKGFEVINVGKGNLTVTDLVLPFHSNCLDYHISNPKFNVVGCDFNMEDHSRTMTTQEYSSGAESAAEARMFRRFGQIVVAGKLEPQWSEYSLKTQKVLDKCYDSARQGGGTVTV